MASKLRITYVKSSIGYRRRQKATVQSLGLRRLHQTVELPDNPAIRGMVFRVRHLVRVEQVEDAAGAEAAGEAPPEAPAEAAPGRPTEVEA